MRFPLVFSLLLAAACPAPQSPSKTASLSGSLVLTPGTRGDAYVLLNAPSTGDLFSLAAPVRTAAVSDQRLSEGDLRFRFNAVEPNAYALTGILDGNRNLDPEVDVLSQPGAGDRITRTPIDLSINAGEQREQDLPIDLPIARDPPAFAVEGYFGTIMALPDQPALVTFNLIAADLPQLPQAKAGWVVHIADDDGDGQPDDAEGDGIVDVYPRIFLRYVPGPGQTTSTAQILVPLAFDPSPFLTYLGSDVQQFAVADRLLAVLIPRPVAVSTDPEQGVVTQSLDAIPVGDYELWMVEPGNQFWRIPNGLAETHPDQNVRFQFVHGNTFDGGSPQ
ncbi:MAG: hypothetical protein ACT4TC_16450 [Myxococcaceae bacterium]